MPVIEEVPQPELAEAQFPDLDEPQIAEVPQEIPEPPVNIQA